jgi:hypothetical protein
LKALIHDTFMEFGLGLGDFSIIYSRPGYEFIYLAKYGLDLSSSHTAGNRPSSHRHCKPDTVFPATATTCLSMVEGGGCYAQLLVASSTNDLTPSAQWNCQTSHLDPLSAR